MAGPACAGCGADGESLSLRELRANLAGKAISLWFCPACADRAGVPPATSDLPLVAADLLAGLFEPGAQARRDDIVCQGCGTSYRMVRQTGRVGCMACYETFRLEIDRLLPRLSRGTRHAGRLPARFDPYRELFAPLSPASISPAAASIESPIQGNPAEHPIALHSRVELYRNAMDFPFPERLSKAAGIRFLAALDRFFRSGSADHAGLVEFPLLGVGALQRWFRAADDRLGCLVNQQDHFRLYRQGPGLCWSGGLADLHHLETSLERVFPFAVNLAWGHLSSSLATLGTGLKARVRLHLPALSAAHGAAAVEGLVPGLRGCPASAGLGACFELCNSETLGQDEHGLLDQLARSTQLLLHYEQSAAIHERERDPAAYDDRAWRQWGSLRYCRQLDLAGLWQFLDGLRPALLAGVFQSADDQAKGEVRPDFHCLNQLAALGAADPAELAGIVRTVCGNPG